MGVSEVTTMTTLFDLRWLSVVGLALGLFGAGVLTVRFARIGFVLLAVGFLFQAAGTVASLVFPLVKGP